MIELKNNFLIIKNGHGIEMSGLSLAGVQMIDCEFCNISYCEIRSDPENMRGEG